MTIDCGDSENRALNVLNKMITKKLYCYLNEMILSSMYRFYVSVKTFFPSSFVITLITWITYTFMNRLNVFLKITCCCCFSLTELSTFSILWTRFNIVDHNQYCGQIIWWKSAPIGKNSIDRIVNLFNIVDHNQYCGP